MNGERLISIPALTGLRFVAAALVLLSHSVIVIFKFPTTPPGWFNLTTSWATEGMTLFFVLSGFVIYYNYSGSLRAHGVRGAYNFFVARFARLYPLYFVCLLYDLLMKWSYQQLPISTGKALLYYVTLTQSWLYKPFGGHALIYQFGVMPQLSWSISTEWFFYIMFPVIWLLLARPAVRRRIVIAALFAIATITVMTVVNLKMNALNRYGVATFGPVADFYANHQDSFFQWLAYFSPYARIPEFILGCMCASIYMSLRSKPISRTEQPFGTLLIAAALSGIVALHLFVLATRWSMLMNFGLAPFMAVLIFCCARYNNAFVRLMSAPLLLVCGEASYSLYMLHMLPIMAFRWEAAVITAPAVLVGVALQWVVTVLGAIGLSLVSWRLIEVPTRRFLRHLLSVEVRPVMVTQAASPGHADSPPETSTTAEPAVALSSVQTPKSY